MTSFSHGAPGRTATFHLGVTGILMVALISMGFACLGIAFIGFGIAWSGEAPVTFTLLIAVVGCAILGIGACLHFQWPVGLSISGDSVTVAYLCGLRRTCPRSRVRWGTISWTDTVECRLLDRPQTGRLTLALWTWTDASALRELIERWDDESISPD